MTAEQILEFFESWLATRSPGDEVQIMRTKSNGVMVRVGGSQGSGATIREAIEAMR